MKAKDMPCVTVEQVLRLRDHASSVEHQRDQLREALSELLAVQYDGDPRRQADCELCAKARAALKSTEEG